MSNDNYARALEIAGRWLEVVNKTTLSEGEAAEVINDTVDNFARYLNPGMLEYRKSVTEAGDFAATEWRGEGCILRDVSGREWIDCLGGYGIFNLGWSPKPVLDAVQAQMRKCQLPSQELIDPLRGALAQLLATVTPGDIRYSFFNNSGAEAVEGALKLAKLVTGRRWFIAAVKGFHGKTLGALSMLGKADYREPVGVMYPYVIHVPYGDADAVEQRLQIGETTGERIAGVIMEPVQGEAGAIDPPDDYWPRLRELCDGYGSMLIADEVQTGMGRTGKLWGVEHWDVVPDIMSSAKALGGGVMPIGAFMSTADHWQHLIDPNPFLQTTTFGGNPLSCAAAIATIKTLIENDLPAQAADKGAYFKAQISGLADRYPDIFERVTGKGLLIGMHFHNADVGYAVAAQLFKRGVLVAGTLTSAKSIRIEPPLIISREQIDTVLNRLEDTLAEVNNTLQTPAYA